MYDDNRIVVTGLNQVGRGGPQTYDHPITMRKLKGSSIYLLYQLVDPAGTSSVGVRVYATAQLHYLER